MTFSVIDTLNNLTAARKLDPFDFTGLDGKTYQLPNLKLLTFEVVARLDGGDILGVIDEIAPLAASAVRAIPVAVLEPMTQEWMRHSEETPGESAASSLSSTSTVRQSKPTSRSAASTKPKA